jgi:hypothetical protein
LEPTSGSTGGEKWIPCTRSLRQQFQRCVAAWIGDLFWNIPAVRAGRAYWSISPVFGPPRRTPSGIPIGFADDASYLGLAERLLLQKLLVAPAALTRLTDMAVFRYATLLSLLRARDLSLISIWNPTFLTALFTSLADWQQRLCQDVQAGTFTPPAPVARELALSFHSTPDRGRAEQLRSAFPQSDTLADIVPLLWPQLALISCWGDAAASLALAELRTLFPATPIQPKGLLATEGCVTFPLVGRPGGVLALRSHFFEFEDDSGTIWLAHELAAGQRYRVILTTGGGLYRYQLRDEVEVVGFAHQAPLLGFIGKADRVSDLVGEKLAEPHVRSVLEDLFRRFQLLPRFALLVPVLAQPARYRLYLQTDHPASKHAQREWTAALQAGLESNPHYRYAVQLGQLAPVEIALLAPARETAWNLYQQECLRRGQKAGSIKPATLDPWTGWPSLFRSLTLDQSPCRVEQL